MLSPAVRDLMPGVLLCLVGAGCCGWVTMSMAKVSPGSAYRYYLKSVVVGGGWDRGVPLPVGQEPPAARAARVTDGAPPAVDVATTPETTDNPQNAPAPGPASPHAAESADLAPDAVLTPF